MAIAFDAKSTVGFDSSSQTLSHTCSGADRLLVVAIVIDGTETVTAITYAGVSMTQLVTVAPGNFRIYLFYLLAPATGANNISVTLSGNQDVGIMAASYTGVAQSSPTDGTASGADDNTDPFGRSITTSQANSLVVLASADNNDNVNQRTPSASSNERHDVIVGSGAGTFGGFFSDRVTTAAGSYTLTYAPDPPGSVTAATCVIAAFKEATGAFRFRPGLRVTQAVSRAGTY